MNTSKIDYLFEHLEHFGKIEQPSYVGMATDFKRNDILYVQIKLKEDIIVDIKYQIINKPIIYAICEIISKILINKKIRDCSILINEQKVIAELGNIPLEYIYAVSLYRNAFNTILTQYNKEHPQIQKRQEGKFKRLLNFNDEDDPDVLTEEQVKKLLNAVDELKKSNNQNKYENFNKVKDSVIGKNKEENIQSKIITPIDKSKLLEDNVPDFDSYEDNTVGLEFESKEVGQNLEDFNKLPSLKDLGADFDELSFDFENDLDFSNYNFEDNQDSKMENENIIKKEDKEK